MQCRYCTRNEDYLVFADGNIYSRKSQKMLKPRINSNGYYRATLFKDGKKSHTYIHRLVAEAFIPNPENKPCINHINGDKSDNRVENLEWCSHSENQIHAVNTSLRTYDSMSKPVIQYTKTGEFVGIYPSAHEAARQTEISQRHISAVCRGGCGYKSTGGYVWRFVGSPFSYDKNRRGLIVAQYTRSGELVAVYSSASEAARETGINQGNISAVCRGKYGYKSAGGYIWRYVDEGP